MQENDIALIRSSKSGPSGFYVAQVKAIAGARVYLKKCEADTSPAYVPQHTREDCVVSTFPASMANDWAKVVQAMEAHLEAVSAIEKEAKEKRAAADQQAIDSFESIGLWHPR